MTKGSGGAIMGRIHRPGGRMKRPLVLLPAAVILLGLFGCGYNEMQAKEEAVFAAWGDVEAAYQRRADLVPNLVEVVKGYAKHENETLVAVTEARARGGLRSGEQGNAEPARGRPAFPAGPVAARRGPFAAPCDFRAVSRPEGRSGVS